MTDPHAPRHKFQQHDVDPSGQVDDPESMDPDEAWAGAVTPGDYVLSSDEAMASALMQAEYGDG